MVVITIFSKKNLILMSMIIKYIYFINSISTWIYQKTSAMLIWFLFIFSATKKIQQHLKFLHSISHNWVIKNKIYFKSESNFAPKSSWTLKVCEEIKSAQRRVRIMKTCAVNHLASGSYPFLRFFEHISKSCMHITHHKNEQDAFADPRVIKPSEDLRDDYTMRLSLRSIPILSLSYISFRFWISS